MHVVGSVTAFDAQATMIGRAIAAFHFNDRIVLYLVGDLAADAAKGAQRIDFFRRLLQRRAVTRRQSAGRTRLHTFAAADAGRIAHGIVKIEDDFAVTAASGKTDYAIHLLFATGTRAAAALYACVEIDRNGRMRNILLRLRACIKTRFAHFQFLRPIVQFIIACIAFGRHIAQQ